MTLPLEYCFKCNDPTGRAGRYDDSLYLGNEGPYCRPCFDKANPPEPQDAVELAQAIVGDTVLDEDMPIDMTTLAQAVLDMQERIDKLLANKEDTRGKLHMWRQYETRKTAEVAALRTALVELMKSVPLVWEDDGARYRAQRRMAAADAVLLAAVPDTKPDGTYPMPEHGWTCFHCGETFMKPGEANDHFGHRPGLSIACRLTKKNGLMELRKAEAALPELAVRLEKIHGNEVTALRTALELAGSQLRAHVITMETLGGESQHEEAAVEIIEAALSATPAIRQL